MSSFCYYLCKICLCIFFFAGSSAWAHDPHPAFKQYDVDNGLASSKVYQVKQDSKGYIWFATSNGVSRFNGYEFENFSMNDGLPDNTVFEIFEDKTGRIWFLPLSNMLSYYYNGKIYPYKYNSLIQKNLTEQAVKTSFCVNDSGTVFFGLHYSGICSITEQGTFTMFPTQNVIENGLIVFEPLANYFVYANNGKSKNKSHIEFKTKDFSKNINLNKEIEDIHAGARIIKSLKNNSIAFSIENSLFVINKDATYKEHVLDHRIIWLYEDLDGDLWIGNYLGGVYYVHNGDFKNKICYLKNSSVTGVLQDREGGFWFTTEGNSVYYTPSKKILTYDKESGLEDSRINCLASDKQALYIGLQAGFIHRLSSTGKIESYDCSKSADNSYHNDITSLYCDTLNSELWYSGSKNRGIIKNGINHGYCDITFYKLLQTGHNSFWAINSHGIFNYIDKTPDRRASFYKRKMKRINAILKKDDNTLLTGAIDGLYEYRLSDHTYNYLGERDPLLKKRIMDLAYTKDGTLVIATKGSGVLIRDNDEITQLDITKGLSSNNVFKLLIEDTIIWAATDKGLNKITRHKNGAIENTIHIFTTNDGLASNEINDIRKFNHNIWVATDKGLSFFNEDYLTFSLNELPVYITHIAVNDSNRIIKRTYDLSYSENNIKIVFIALSYKHAEKIQYRYRMQGLDTTWLYTKNREIQYTTLPPGNYKFIVTASNANGTWSKQAEIEFLISIPFWKTWWFLFFLLLCLIGVIFYIVRFIFKRKQEKKSKGEEINRVLLQLKLKALRAQINPHFIFNVMSSIQHFILFKNNEVAHLYLSKFSKLIRTVLNNSEKNMIPLSEEIKALTLYLDLENMRLEKHFEQEINVDESLDINKIDVPSMLIQPYVENAVKHGILPSRKAGKIKIAITRHQAFLKCTIEDNGVGRAFTVENKSSDYRSFGTAITKERLAVINELYDNRLSENVTDLYDEHKVPAGTKVEIYIPFNQN